MAPPETIAAPAEAEALRAIYLAAWRAVCGDESEARMFFEQRRWPLGPVCPHCGSSAPHLTRLSGNRHRAGVFQCKRCHRQSTVTVGTLLDRSHIPLRKWLLAICLMVVSDGRISITDMQRRLGITYKSAWAMAHRIRRVMASCGPQQPAAPPRHPPAS